jgi:hypothetical protein
MNHPEGVERLGGRERHGESTEFAIFDFGIGKVDVDAQSIPAQIQRRYLGKIPLGFAEETAGAFEARRGGSQPSILSNSLVQ